MLQIIASLIAGTLMGAGLMISGMMNPNKVLSFLDIFGNWDPTLIFVMGGQFFLHSRVFGFHVGLQNPC